MGRPRTLDSGQRCSFWLDREHRAALDAYAAETGLSCRSQAIRAILAGLGSSGEDEPSTAPPDRTDDRTLDQTTQQEVNP